MSAAGRIIVIIILVSVLYWVSLVFIQSNINYSNNVNSRNTNTNINININVHVNNKISAQPSCPYAICIHTYKDIGSFMDISRKECLISSDISFLYHSCLFISINNSYWKSKSFGQIIFPNYNNLFYPKEHDTIKYLLHHHHKINDKWSFYQYGIHSYKDEAFNALISSNDKIFGWIKLSGKHHISHENYKFINIENTKYHYLQPFSDGYIIPHLLRPCYQQNPFHYNPIPIPKDDNDDMVIWIKTTHTSPTEYIIQSGLSEYFQRGRPHFLDKNNDAVFVVFKSILWCLNLDKDNCLHCFIDRGVIDRDCDRLFGIDNAQLNGLNVDKFSEIKCVMSNNDHIIPITLNTKLGVVDIHNIFSFPINSSNVEIRCIYPYISIYNPDQKRLTMLLQTEKRINEFHYGIIEMNTHCIIKLKTVDKLVIFYGNERKLYLTNFLFNVKLLIYSNKYSIKNLQCIETNFGIYLSW
eukprot:78069_1